MSYSQHLHNSRESLHIRGFPEHLHNCLSLDIIYIDFLVLKNTDLKLHAWIGKFLFLNTCIFNILVWNKINVAALV